MHLHTHSRAVQDLSGTWSLVPDPYDQFGETGAFGGNRIFDPEAQEPPIDAHVDDGYDVTVPGCWNEQLPAFEHYEGAMWYARRFRWDGSGNGDGSGDRNGDRSGDRNGEGAFLHFGAVNYRADVYLDGENIGSHEGGFTPFAFEVTDRLDDRDDHLLVVRVDNRRAERKLPAERTDWFNFGGITREVSLVTVPERFLRNVKVETAIGEDSVELSVTAWIDGPAAADDEEPLASLPDLDRTFTLEPGDSWQTTPHVGADETISGRVYEGTISRARDDVDLWSPNDPVLYDLTVATDDDSIRERIGLREVTVDGSDVLVNGDPIQLDGISLHEEADGRGRALRPADRRERIEWIADLGCTFARLAHYPHHPEMARLADEEGILLWEEVPAYWWVDFDDPAVVENYRQQLRELLQRDWNRPSVILWSIANETDTMETARNEVLPEMTEYVRDLDETRLVTAACFVDETDDGELVVEDPLADHLDVFGVNQYRGWYEGEANDFQHLRDDPAGPPIVVSEVGAGAKRDNRGPSDELWTEQHQADFYRSQLDTLSELEQVAGISPWILFDFRSPRRQNPHQRGYNRKGLLDENGEPKAAYEVLRRHYDEGSSEE